MLHYSSIGLQISSTSHMLHSTLPTSAAFAQPQPAASDNSSPSPPADSHQQQFVPRSSSSSSKAKYKSNIMEKYLRDLQPPAMLEVKNEPTGGADDEAAPAIGGGELSKWLESAANFQPDKNNYIEWEGVGGVR